MSRFLFCLAFLAISASPSFGDDVYVVQISGTIEKGLAAFVDRVMEEAELENVRAVIFEIDTPGGVLEAALVIRDAVLYSEV